MKNDFNNLCEWYLDNKLSIHFGEDKTKSILFGSKHKLRKVDKLNITYQGIDITYLVCILYETMSGEPMAYKTIKKINSRLNYLFRKKHFLTTSLRRLLCNACTAWYPNLCKKLKNRIQTTQKKCVRFCINLDKMAHISQNELEKLNWLSVSDRINQCILSTTFKFVNDTGPNYLNEVFQWAVESKRTLRNDYLKLKHPFHQTTAGQNSPYFLGPSKWNRLPESKKSVITSILSNII